MSNETLDLEEYLTDTQNMLLDLVDDMRSCSKTCNWQRYRECLEDCCTVIVEAGATLKDVDIQNGLKHSFTRLPVKIDGKFIDEFDEPKDVFLTAYEDVESVGRESDYYYTGYNPSTCKFAVFVSSRPIRQLHTPWLDIRCVLGIEFKNEAGRMLNEEGYIPLTIQMLQQEMRYKHDLH